MADDKNKGSKKPHFHEHLPKKGLYGASTDELLKYLQAYNANTEEAASKRSEIEQKQENAINRFRDITKDYLIKKRGESQEHKNTPKASFINSHEEAEELIFDLAKESFKQRYGDELLKGMDKDRIIEHLYHKGINYHDLKLKLISNKRYLKTQEFQQTLAKLHYVDEAHTENLAKRILENDIKHHDGIKKHANEKLKNIGRELKADANISDLVNDILPELYQTGRLEEIQKYESNFKKYKKAA